MLSPTKSSEKKLKIKISSAQSSPKKDKKLEKQTSFAMQKLIEYENKKQLLKEFNNQTFQENKIKIETQRAGRANKQLKSGEILKYNALVDDGEKRVTTS
jgi:hypothetical protein